jgi:hypothetical protein
VFVVIVTIVTVTKRSIGSSNSYFDINDNDGEVYM